MSKPFNFTCPNCKCECSMKLAPTEKLNFNVFKEKKDDVLMMLDFIEAYKQDLSKWETKFYKSLADQIKTKNEISQKQLATLKKLKKKIESHNPEVITPDENEDFDAIATEN
jgi:hypothetical protein